MRVRVCAGALGDERGSEFPGAGGTGNCESHDMDTVWDPGQPGVCKETLPQKNKQQQKK